MSFCLVDIARLKQWELRPEERVISYSVRLNPKTQLINTRFAIAHTLRLLKSTKLKFNFTVYGGNGEKLYEYKN